MTELLTFMFQPVWCKVRFHNEESAIKGCGLLARSGGAEVFGENVYGVFSKKQLITLRKHKIKFDIIKKKRI